MPATRNGHLGASDDLGQIDRWWTECPDFNLATCPHDNGWAVIDEEAGTDPSWTEGRPLPETYTVGTPRGGTHKYYDGECRSTVKRLGPTVDSRGVGGYVLLPPSVFYDQQTGKTGRYKVLKQTDLAELPDWIAEKLAKTTEKAKAPENVILDQPGNVGRAICHLKNLPATREGEGSDDKAYKAATALCDLGLSEAKAVEIMMAHFKCEPKDLAWITSKVANGYEYAENEPGAYAGRPMQERFGPALAKLIASGYLPAPEDEPLDLLGDPSLTGPAVVTREMLPKAIADAAFDAAERLGVEPAMVAIPMLAVCAAALHDGIQIQPRVKDTGWTESARLWFALVADPGGKKTPAMSAASKVLRDLEARWRQEDAIAIAKYVDAKEDRKAARRARNDAIKDLGVDSADVSTRASVPEVPKEPPQRRLVVGDTTMEALAHILVDNPRAVMIFRDELTGMIAGLDAYRSNGAGKDKAAALELWNGGPQSIDRRKEDGSIHVPNWSASVLGGIQPGKLREIAPKLGADGFLQRFQPFYGRTLGIGVDREPDHVAIDHYAAVVHLLVGMQPTPAPVRLDTEAHEHRRYVEEIAQAFIVLPTTPPALKSHLAKWGSMFARLLLSLHAIECASKPGGRLQMTVNGATARQARDIMLRFFLPNAIAFYDEFFRGQDIDSKHARWIAGHILSRKLDAITASNVKEAYRELENDEDGIRRAMGLLQQARWVEEAEAKKGSARWTVKSLVHERFAERAKAEKQRRETVVANIREAAERVKTLKK